MGIVGAQGGTQEARQTDARNLAERDGRRPASALCLRVAFRTCVSVLAYA